MSWISGSFSGSLKIHYFAISYPPLFGYWRMCCWCCLCVISCGTSSHHFKQNCVKFCQRKQNGTGGGVVGELGGGIFPHAWLILTHASGVQLLVYLYFPASRVFRCLTPPSPSLLQANRNCLVMASTHDIQELDVSSILATQILTWIDDDDVESKG